MIVIIIHTSILVTLIENMNQEPIQMTEFSVDMDRALRELNKIRITVVQYKIIYLNVNY